MEEWGEGLELRAAVMQEQSIFIEALEKEDPAERRAFLDRACAADPALRQRLERLLHRHQQAGSFLQPPAFSLGATVDEAVSECPGSVIGPYRLMEQIGEGGMGLVFVAEQQQPVRRKVALKLIKPGMDTREVIARFEAERQALALMDHPNIARILDGGATASGRPYFVMELVRGVPVTGFCDENRLTPRERLELFVSVCQAVQHAHQKGIIHRDLKPSNILVTLHDGTPVPKVIDFGVAKAVGQQLTDKTIYTRFAQLIGTPLYMSPEQAEMSGLDIDTRSDIYALGVLLYELLTGTTPFDGERLKTVGFDEIRRIIREEEPPRPSTRMSTLGEAFATVSANRRCEPGRLSQLLRGELDWIVMKALEKDRNRRYETASAFAADVQRYLRDEPVLACPPTLGYRLGKMVRRHRSAVLAVSLVVLALVGGIIGTTWGLIRATDERDQKVAEVKLKQAEATQKEAALAAARQSEGKATDRRFEALVNQARAGRWSGRVGQRFGVLKAIREAAQIRITPELGTEATAALVLSDVEIAREWEGWPEGSVGLGFDADFQRYARLDRQGGVTVCRLSDGREEVLARLPPHGKPPFSTLLMSPDGRFVIFGHSVAGYPPMAGAVTVWRLDGPAPKVILDEKGLHGWAWAFHRNSRRLALGYRDGPVCSVCVYDLETGQRVCQLKVQATPLHLAFHPRDGRLAVARGRAVQLFNTETGKELPALHHPETFTWTHSLSWHPDGRRLAVAYTDRKIHVWDTQTATEVMPPWEGHTVNGVFLTFNHAGDRVLSSDWGGQRRLWDAATGRMLATLPEPVSLQFSSDDRLIGPEISGKKLRLWRVAGGRELRVLRSRSADRLSTIASPVVHPDGRTLAAGSENRLCFFDLASGEELASVWLPHAGMALPAFFDPPRPSRPSTAGGKGDGPGGWMTGDLCGLLFWPARPDPARPEVLCVGPPQQLTSGEEAPFSAGSSASTDGRVVAVPGGSSTVVLHRDPADGRVLRRLVLRPQFDVRSCAVSPDGRWVVTFNHWSDGRSRDTLIWNANTGQQVPEQPLPSSPSARFSPDGRWLVTSKRNCILWEVGTWREVRRFADGAAAFSPDSRLLAIGDVFGVVRLLETGTEREVARLTGPEPLWYSPACFTPDGTRLVATCSGMTALYVWDLRLIRSQLKELGLDWDWHEFQPADPGTKLAADRKVEVLLGHLAPTSVSREQKARQAIDRYRRDVEASPDDANACNSLAWAYLAAPGALRDVKAALQFAEKAVRLAPGKAQYRNTLGAAHYKAGQYRDALETLRPNLERQADGVLGFDLYLLAMTYHRLGETMRGRDYYNRAIHWTKAGRSLSAEHLEQLSWFREEAEALFGVDERKH